MLWMILVCLLGSNDFATRERAHRVLAANSDAAVTAIAAGEYSDDPEIAERCRTMMNAWWRKHADRLVDDYKPFNGWPWLDHCDEIPWETFQDYMAKARGSGGGTEEGSKRQSKRVIR